MKGLSQMQNLRQPLKVDKGIAVFEAFFIDFRTSSVLSNVTALSIIGYQIQEPCQALVIRKPRFSFFASRIR